MRNHISLIKLLRPILSLKLTKYLGFRQHFLLFWWENISYFHKHHSQAGKKILKTTYSEKENGECTWVHYHMDLAYGFSGRNFYFISMKVTVSYSHFMHEMNRNTAKMTYSIENQTDKRRDKPQIVRVLAPCALWEQSNISQIRRKEQTPLKKA